MVNSFYCWSKWARVNQHQVKLFKTHFGSSWVKPWNHLLKLLNLLIEAFGLETVLWCHCDSANGKTLDKSVSIILMSHDLYQPIRIEPLHNLSKWEKNGLNILQPMFTPPFQRTKKFKKKLRNTRSTRFLSHFISYVGRVNQNQV